MRSALGIPVIDLSEALHSGDARSATVAAQIRSAAETSGFFYVASHGVPRQLVERQFEAAAKFFALPADQKEPLSMRNSQAMRGYESIGSQTLDASANADLKESFQCGFEYAPTHPYVVKRYETYGQNQWPAQMPEFETTCLDYLAAVQNLSQRLMQLLALSLGLPEGYFDRLNDNPADILRMLRYPPQPAGADSKTFGAGAHTDWGAITILAQDANGGLEVKMPDDSWVAATPIPDTFVVNLGDMIPRWTNGRYRSNLHRVRNLNASARDRYSVVFFVDLDWEARIEPIEGLEPAEDGTIYQPCTVGEHMGEMYRKTYGVA